MYKLSNAVFLVFIFFSVHPSFSKSRNIKPDLDGFKKYALSFLKENCFSCHDEDTQKGNVSLHDLTPSFNNEENIGLWEKVLTQSLLGQMPPEKKKRPDTVKLQEFVEWIDTEFVRVGNDSLLHNLTTQPSYGNYVNHEQLFNGRNKGPAYSPSRLWRKNLYNGQDSLSLPSREGIRDYADEGLIDEPTLNSLMAVIGTHLDTQLNGRISSANHKKGKLVGINSTYDKMVKAENPTDEMRQNVIRVGFQDALGRLPLPEEVPVYLDLLDKNVKKGGKKMGIKMTVMAIHLKPEAFFRMELGLGKKMPDGRYRLSGQEAYFAVLYALFDDLKEVNEPRFHKKQIGDVKIRNYLDELKKGTFDSREGVRRIVEYSLNNDKMHKSRIGRFFTEFFGYAPARTAFKDAPLSYNHNKYLMTDLTDFIDGILDEDKNVFEKLLTSSKYPLSVTIRGGGDKIGMLTTSYGFSREEVSAIMKARVTDPKNKKIKVKVVHDFKNERAGVLTHPTWTFAFASNDETHPVHRGKWVLERLLAKTVPAVPVTVEAKVPEDHGRTLRQRLDVTKEEYCWSCHKKMNPLGLVFESYNYMGKFTKMDQRVTEESKKGNGNPVWKMVDVGPVNSSVELSEVGVEELKGVKVKNAVELMKMLGKSKRVRQSIIRHAFRYWMGRNETLDDSPTLMAADQAYVESNGSFKAMLVALLTSDSFLYRK